MNKVELVAAIADKAGITKADAERALNAFTETVEETLKKGEQIAASNTKVPSGFKFGRYRR